MSILSTPDTMKVEHDQSVLRFNKRVIKMVVFGNFVISALGTAGFGVYIALQKTTPESTTLFQCTDLSGCDDEYNKLTKRTINNAYGWDEPTDPDSGITVQESGCTYFILQGVHESNFAILSYESGDEDSYEASSYEDTYEAPSQRMKRKRASRRRLAGASGGATPTAAFSGAEPVLARVCEAYNDWWLFINLLYAQFLTIQAGVYFIVVIVLAIMGCDTQEAKMVASGSSKDLAKVEPINKSSAA